MTTTDDRGDRGNAVTLPADLTIAQVAVTRAAFDAALRDPRPLEIEAARVTSFDMAGLQLLVAAARCARRHPTWKNVPDSLRDAVTRLGLGSVLGFVDEEAA